MAAAQEVLWIISANRSFAKIYEAKGHGREIKEIQHIENPDGRKKISEIVSDRPGRSFDSVGGGRHALGTQVDAREHELQGFLHKLAHILDEGLKSKAYSQLALVAPPHVLGALVVEISDNVRKVLIKEVGKDLPERISNEERIEMLCKYLDLWNHAKREG